MRVLKPVFISSYMMLIMASSIYAGWMLVDFPEFSMAWFGVLLTTAPIMMLIGWLMLLRNTARTPSHLLGLHIIAAAGLALAAFDAYSSTASFMPLMLAVIGLVGLLMYDYWYSLFTRQPTAALQIGKVLPEFSLRDIKGNNISSAYFRDKASIIIFFRGNWCPLCIAQVKEIAAQYRAIESLGFRVALVSPQSHNKTIALSSRFDVRFEFFTDNNNSAARILGIDDPHGLPLGMQMLGYDTESVMPTVMITDQEGKVIWSHETDNYRVRPEPSQFLDVLRQHGVDLNLA